MTRHMHLERGGSALSLEPQPLTFVESFISGEEKKCASWADLSDSRTLY
jgi:hypothetical protein